MENQMQAQPQPENVQPAIQPQGQNEYGYFDAFGDAFKRILKNKILWVWGIFLTAGGFSFNGGSGGTDELNSAEAEQFLSEFLWVIPVIIGVFLLIGIAFWIFSTIVRPGVIRALDRLQNNSESEVKHRDIWEQGKARFVEIIKLDLIIFLISIGFFVLLGILAAILIGIGFAVQDNIGIIVLLGLLGFILFVIFIIALVVLFFVKSFGTVFVALGDMNWSIVIKTSYNLIKENKMETFKLYLINMLIGIIGGIVGMIVFVIIFIIAALITVPLFIAFQPLGIIVGIIFAIILIALALLFKSFMSLWSQDVTVWWVKKMKGVEAPQKEQEVVEVDNVKEEFSAEETTPQGDLVMESENKNI